MNSVDTQPPEVRSLVEEFVSGVREALGDNLVAVFPRGSLALGDFDADYSDVDAFVVTERRVSDEEFERLGAMHDRLRKLANRYSEGLEVAYIDKESMRRFHPGESHPTITSHDEFRWERHDSNWVLDRWMAREHAHPWFGVEPKLLIDPISEEDLRAAARQRLLEWGKWAEDVPEEDRSWYEERAHQCYVIETVCRGLYTVALASLPTKQEAVSWASGALPEEWREFLERTREWRGQDFSDEATAFETTRFVCWAAAEAA